MKSKVAQGGGSACGARFAVSPSDYADADRSETYRYLSGPAEAEGVRIVSASVGVLKARVRQKNQVLQQLRNQVRYLRVVARLQAQELDKLGIGTAGLLRSVKHQNERRVA